jgi:hypothetical protein
LVKDWDCVWKEVWQRQRNGYAQSEKIGALVIHRIGKPWRNKLDEQAGRKEVPYSSHMLPENW